MEETPLDVTGKVNGGPPRGKLSPMQVAAQDIQALPVIAGASRPGTAEHLYAERLYAENEKLVGFVLARCFSGLQGAAREDAEQAGRVGLWMAAQGFDSGRGFQFSTYATRCIRGRILRGLMREHRALPPGLLSLDAAWPGRDGGDARALGDALPDPKGEAAMAAVREREAFGGRLAGLRPRERRVLLALYGDGRTLQDVGNELGVSRAMASTLKRRGEARLRARWASPEEWEASGDAPP